MEHMYMEPLMILSNAGFQALGLSVFAKHLKFILKSYIAGTMRFWDHVDQRCVKTGSSDVEMETCYVCITNVKKGELITSATYWCPRQAR